MAHFTQHRFVEHCRAAFPEFFTGTRVVEMGSYDVNGSCRSLFRGGTYTGVDLVPGPGVEVVCRSDLFDGESDSYDVAISCECFEHNPHWHATFHNMIRLTRPGGLVIITSAGRGRIEHGTNRSRPYDSPGTHSTGVDYYKNLTRADFKDAAELSKIFSNWRIYIQTRAHDIYFLGQCVGQGIADDKERWLDLDRRVKGISAEYRSLRLAEGGRLRYSLGNLKHLILKILCMTLSEQRYQSVALVLENIKNKLVQRGLWSR